MAEGGGVVVGGALVGEHGVIAHGDAHEVVASSGGEHDGQVFDGVLVGAGVVGVAGVASHWDTGQLAHEVIFEACALNLAGVVQIFGADEADDGVDLVGMVAFGEAVASGFEDELIPAVVRLCGEFCALTGFKVHEVGAFGEAMFFGERVGFV